MAVKRWSAGHPCPICGGHDQSPRGKGQRCTGFESDDGTAAFCSREEHAGGLTLITTTQPESYCHKLRGACGCGQSHGSDVLPSAPGSSPDPQARRVKARSARPAQDDDGDREIGNDEAGTQARRSTFVEAYDYRDESGQVAYRVARFEPKAFRPQHEKPRGSGTWVNGLNGQVKVPYRLPELLSADREAAVYLCEGEKDANAAIDRGLIATTNSGGTGGWGLWTKAGGNYLRGRKVVIVPDLDDAGRKFALDVAGAIVHLVKWVKLVRPPGMPEKADLTDWFVNGGTVSTLAKVVDEAPVWTPGEPIYGDDVAVMPEIAGDEPRLGIVTPHAWAAMNLANKREMRYFVRAGIPCRIIHDDDGNPQIQPLDADRLRYEVARSARWFEKVFDKNGIPSVKEKRPSLEVVKDMLASPLIPLPVLSRLVQVPVFGPNGELRVTPGYDEPSRTFYQPPPGVEIPPVPEIPTAADRHRAHELILGELLGDFPFVDEADRAHAVAALLLPFVREIIGRGNATPGHMFEAPTQGTGKGLLARVCMIPSVGEHVTTIGQPDTDAEWGKTLLGVLLEAPSVIMIDNITRRIESGDLARAITEPIYGQRMLGSNDMKKIPVRVAWIFTANNPTFGADMTRRFIRCRIDPAMDRPFMREQDGFRHPRLVQWASEHRGELVWSALVMVRHWMAIGRPFFTSRTLGSFERWAGVIGGILQANAIGGFLGNVLLFLEQADVEGNAWRALVASWWEQHQGNPVASRDLLPLAKDIDGLPLRGANELALLKSFGRAIATQRDRVYGHWRIKQAGTAHHATYWRLIDMRKGAAAGSTRSIGPQVTDLPLFEMEDEDFPASEGRPELSGSGSLETQPLSEITPVTPVTPTTPDIADTYHDRYHGSYGSYGSQFHLAPGDDMALTGLSRDQNRETPKSPRLRLRALAAAAGWPAARIGSIDLVDEAGWMALSRSDNALVDAGIAWLERDEGPASE